MPQLTPRGASHLLNSSSKSAAADTLPERGGRPENLDCSI